MHSSLLLIVLALATTAIARHHHHHHDHHHKKNQKPSRIVDIEEFVQLLDIEAKILTHNGPVSSADVKKLLDGYNTKMIPLPPGPVNSPNQKLIICSQIFSNITSAELEMCYKVAVSMQIEAATSKKNRSRRSDSAQPPIAPVTHRIVQEPAETKIANLKVGKTYWDEKIERQRQQAKELEKIAFTPEGANLSNAQVDILMQAYIKGLLEPPIHPNPNEIIH